MSNNRFLKDRFSRGTRGSPNAIPHDCANSGYQLARSFRTGVGERAKVAGARRRRRAAARSGR